MPHWALVQGEVECRQHLEEIARQAEQALLCVLVQDQEAKDLLGNRIGLRNEHGNLCEKCQTQVGGCVHFLRCVHFRAMSRFSRKLR